MKNPAGRGRMFISGQALTCSPHHTQLFVILLNVQAAQSIDCASYFKQAYLGEKKRWRVGGLQDVQTLVVNNSSQPLG